MVSAEESFEGPSDEGNRYPACGLSVCECDSMCYGMVLGLTGDPTCESFHGTIRHSEDMAPGVALEVLMETYTDQLLRPLDHLTGR